MKQKNEKMKKNLVFLSSKRLERVWKVLVWEKGKSFMQQEVTKWKKNQT